MQTPETARAAIDCLLFKLMPPGSSVRDVRVTGEAIERIIRGKWASGENDPEAVDIGGMPEPETDAILVATRKAKP